MNHSIDRYREQLGGSGGAWPNGHLDTFRELRSSAVVDVTSPDGHRKLSVGRFSRIPGLVVVQLSSLTTSAARMLNREV